MDDRNEFQSFADVPRSEFWRLYFCGHCPNAHIILFDKNDNPIAHATFTATQARYIAKRIDAKDPNFRTITGDDDDPTKSNPTGE